MSKTRQPSLFWGAFKFLVAIFAIFLIVIGIVVAPSPLPFGIIFIILGFFLLTAAAPDFVRWIRNRWRWLDRKLRGLEKRLPKWLAKQLKRSEPDHPLDETEDRATRR